jgi:hypothetical protein
MKDARTKFGDEIPILPYVGVYLSDLTFAEDGNPSFFIDPNAQTSSMVAHPMVNFGKMRLISQIISQICELKRSPAFTYEGTI